MELTAQERTLVMSLIRLALETVPIKNFETADALKALAQKMGVKDELAETGAGNSRKGREVAAEERG